MGFRPLGDLHQVLEPQTARERRLDLPRVEREVAARGPGRLIEGQAQGRPVQ